jgi:hypothetical protein
MTDRRGYLVVMTACIDPSAGAVKVRRSDPLLRLEDYRQALRFWLHLPDPRLNRILFIENSGYSLDAIHQLVTAENRLGKEFEAISLTCNSYPPGLDYGYAELNMLDQGLARSALARQARYYTKATGRLTFPRISKLLDRLPEDFQFAVDSRTALPLRGQKQFWTHTRLMIFSAEFYEKHLRDVKQQLVAGECVEMMMYKVFAEFHGQPGAIRRFPVHVSSRGISGTSGESYDTVKRRALDVLRGLTRRVAPNWWI